MCYTRNLDGLKAHNTIHVNKYHGHHHPLHIAFLFLIASNSRKEEPHFYSLFSHYIVTTPPKLGVCLVWFRSVCMAMANQNWIFRFVKFSTETNQNGLKSIGFGVFWFQLVSVSFLVFQRKGYWDFQNHTLSNNKAKTKAYKITLRIGI